MTRAASVGIAVQRLIKVIYALVIKKFHMTVCLLYDIPKLITEDMFKLKEGEKMVLKQNH